MDSVTNPAQPLQTVLTPRQGESYFDGHTWQLVGYLILTYLGCVFTLGLALPWLLCMLKGWEVKHTVINGRRLQFTGHGHQLIGKYLLWWFLTLITLGIYYFWLGLRLKKWVVKHTVYAEEPGVPSYFTGGIGGFFAMRILFFLVTAFTAGIGAAWGQRMVLVWDAHHTHIGGDNFTFQGKGGQLFVKYVILALLTPLTLGIYPLLFPVRYMKWKTSHTKVITPQTPAAKRGTAVYVIVAVMAVVLALAGSSLYLVNGGISYNEIVIKQNEHGEQILLSEIRCLQPLNVDDVQGELFEAIGQNSDYYSYVLNREVFFDQDNGMLYLEMGIYNQVNELFFRTPDNDQWQTYSVPQDGILQVTYAFPQPPQSLTVVEYGGKDLNTHALTVMVGDINDANVWLDQRYNRKEETEQQQEPQEEAVPLKEMIVGNWYRTIPGTDSQGNPTMDFSRMEFSDEGNYKVGMDYCSLSAVQTPNYADGKYWQLQSGNTYEGVYAVNGDQLTTLYLYAEEGDTREVENAYTITIENDVLTLQYVNLAGETVVEEYTRSQP